MGAARRNKEGSGAVNKQLHGFERNRSGFDLYGREQTEQQWPRLEMTGKAKALNGNGEH